MYTYVPVYTTPLIQIEIQSTGLSLDREGFIHSPVPEVDPVAGYAHWPSLTLNCEGS